MNIAECNILMELQRSGSTSQRALARAVGHSLGVVNRSLKALHEAGYTAVSYTHLTLPTILRV